MKRGIVITTSESTKEWLKECLESLPKHYPLLVVSNGGYYPSSDSFRFPLDLAVNEWNGFELGGIERGCERFDEFVHLMDTCIVKKPSMFDIMFEHPGSMCLCPGFFSYLGKFRRHVLEQSGMPRVDNKDAAIYHERWWTEKYIQFDPLIKQFEPILPIETDVFEDKHGRKNMILDNGFIIKYKGTYGGNVSQKR